MDKETTTLILSKLTTIEAHVAQTNVNMATVSEKLRFIEQIMDSEKAKLRLATEKIHKVEAGCKASVQQLKDETRQLVEKECKFTKFMMIILACVGSTITFVVLKLPQIFAKGL